MAGSGPRVRFEGGKERTLYRFDNGPDYFVEGLARYLEGDRMGFVGPAGTAVIPARFKFVRPFAEGLAAFCVGCRQVPAGDEHTMMVGGRWGFVAHDGREVVPAEFEAVDDFVGGRALVRQGQAQLSLVRCERPDLP
jgi:hypothetical protein